MAKSFFRNVTDQITGGGSKTTDVQLAQAIDRFQDEYSKLSKFKREFDKYIQAMLTADNASHRFFDFIRSLPDSTWSQQSAFAQSCVDIARVRNDHVQHLNKQISSNINLCFKSFEPLRFRIDDQNQIQHDYDKTRKQYQSSVKHDEKIKIDRIKNELDELKSLLNLTNKELRNELPNFHRDLQNNYVKILTEIFDIHSQYYTNFQKICSNFTKKIHGDHLTNSNNHEDNVKETRSSVVNFDKKKPYSIPISQPKRTDYKILHQARVTHDYKAENEDEIDLIKGEYISVISFLNEEDNERDQGWEYAEKSDGTIGLFPVNFAARLYYNEEKE